MTHVKGHLLYLHKLRIKDLDLFSVVESFLMNGYLNFKAWRLHVEIGSLKSNFYTSRLLKSVHSWNRPFIDKGLLGRNSVRRIQRKTRVYIKVAVTCNLKAIRYISVTIKVVIQMWCRTSPIGGVVTYHKWSILNLYQSILQIQTLLATIFHCLYMCKGHTHPL